MRVSNELIPSGTRQSFLCRVSGAVEPRSDQFHGGSGNYTPVCLNRRGCHPLPCVHSPLTKTISNAFLLSEGPAGNMLVKA